MKKFILFSILMSIPLVSMADDKTPAKDVPAKTDSKSEAKTIPAIVPHDALAIHSLYVSEASTQQQIDNLQIQYLKLQNQLAQQDKELKDAIDRAFVDAKVDQTKYDFDLATLTFKEKPATDKK